MTKYFENEQGILPSDKVQAIHYSTPELVKQGTIKQRRKKLGMAQNLLAKRANVSRYNISLYECGIRKLNMKEVSKLERVLKKEEAKKLK